MKGSLGLEGGRKNFFFEKKKQKTFTTWHHAGGDSRPKLAKVFCFFFSKKKSFLPIACLVALTGCMPQLPRPLGRDFSRAAFSSFVLQTTTLPEVEAALGAPMRTSSIKGLANQRAAIVTPGTPIALTLVMYLYAPYGVAPKTTVAPMPVKAATLVFFQGRLIGYDVNSSIPGDDNPPIQEDRLGALHKGTTTREEAIAVLGAPSGQSVSIGAGSMRKSIMTYSWAHVADGTVRRKLLKLQFDESGLFSNYTMLDNSFPVGSAPMALPFQAPPPPNTIPGVERVRPYADPGHT